jgi:hypothetical protein
MMENLYQNKSFSDRLKLKEASKKFAKAGGDARAKALHPKRRSDIASKAAKARWNGKN